jgi:hypothetical protein
MERDVIRGVRPEPYICAKWARSFMYGANTGIPAGRAKLLGSRRPNRDPPPDRRQPWRVGDAFRARRSGAGRRSGRLSGVHPAMVLAHRRACSLSVIAGNSRRSSIAVANSPSRSNAARITAASSSDTTNIPKAWKPEPPGASDASVILRAGFHPVHVVKVEGPPGRNPCRRVAFGSDNRASRNGEGRSAANVPLQPRPRALNPLGIRGGRRGSRGTWGFTPLVPRVALPGAARSGSPETRRQAEVPFRPARYTKFGR